MTLTPHFSITVPIGSFHPRLSDCLASLDAQVVPLEVAVLDASQDPRVFDLVEKFSDRVSYRYHGPDDGQADAIVRGWNHTNGNILGWLNADDVLAPDALMHASKSFTTFPETDLVYGESLICDDDGYINGYHWNVMPPGEHILSTCCISQPSCFFRRSAVEQIGGMNPALHYTMDWDLWVRLYKSGARFKFNQNVRSLVLWSDQAKTGGFGRLRRQELKRILDQNDNPSDRFNGYLGFTSHYFYEYVLPRWARNWVWRRNVSGGEGKFGLSVSGDIEHSATFEMFHYDANEKNSLEVRTPHDTRAFEVKLDKKRLEPVSSKKGSVFFAIPNQVPAGVTCQLEVIRISDSPVHVDGVRFADAP